MAPTFDIVVDETLKNTASLPLRSLVPARLSERGSVVFAVKIEQVNRIRTAACCRELNIRCDDTTVSVDCDYPAWAAGLEV